MIRVAESKFVWPYLKKVLDELFSVCLFSGSLLTRREGLGKENRAPQKEISVLSQA
jgi:hypothetical protein